MKKECFTCRFKLSDDITDKQKEEIRLEAKNNGVRFPYIPSLIFHCKITGKRINQTDPACNKYKGDDGMEDLRKHIAVTAKKLRKKL